MMRDWVGTDHLGRNEIRSAGEIPVVASDLNATSPPPHLDFQRLAHDSMGAHCPLTLLDAMRPMPPPPRSLPHPRAVASLVWKAIVFCH